MDTVARSGGYAVICQTAYDRYFEPSVVSPPGQEYRNERNRRFYQTLLEQHAPIWQSVPDHPIDAFTNPIIKVYRLGKTAQ